MVVVVVVEVVEVVIDVVVVVAAVEDETNLCAPRNQFQEPPKHDNELGHIADLYILEDAKLNHC